MTLKQIKRKIRKARNKLSRVASGMAVAERRIKHHRQQRRKFPESAFPKQHERATKYLRRWQKRQSWLRDRHVFLQTLLDRRLRQKVKWLKAHPEPAANPSGLTWMDGHQVAGWIAEILLRARATGLWNGYVISGWRSAEYSEQLCFNMCGQPSCSGTCAGRNTNHTGINFPEGAADITDPDGLENAMDELGEDRLRNDLPADAPHYSNNGH